jgi:hypothetical protein
MNFFSKIYDKFLSSLPHNKPGYKKPVKTDWSKYDFDLSGMEMIYWIFLFMIIVGKFLWKYIYMAFEYLFN